MFDVGHPPQCQCQQTFISLRLSPADHLGHLQAPKSQSLGVFTSVIVIICVGALVVTIQAKVSTGPSCSRKALIYPLAALASRRSSVRPIPVSLGFLFLRESMQVILSRTLCPWLLRGPTGHRCPYLMLCSRYLCSCSHSDSCLGMVYMGWANHTPLVGKTLTSLLPKSSLSQFPRWDKNRASTHSACCLSITVCTRGYLGGCLLMNSDRLFYFILAWMILIQ